MLIYKLMLLSGPGEKVFRETIRAMRLEITRLMKAIRGSIMYIRNFVCIRNGMLISIYNDLKKCDIRTIYS